MFKNRFEAAHQLALQLKKYEGNEDVVIVAIPRGGLQIGYVLSHELQVPLDVIFSKKIGAPGNPEFAIGAVTIHDEAIDPSFLQQHKEYIDEEIKKLRSILRSREEYYRHGSNPIDLKNKIVIIADDGVATGKTLSMTINIIKKQNPKKIIVALPVAPKDALNEIAQRVDEVICLIIPDVFYSVGQFYESFDQVSDEEARMLFNEAKG